MHSSLDSSWAGFRSQGHLPSPPPIPCPRATEGGQQAHLQIPQSWAEITFFVHSLLRGPQDPASKPTHTLWLLEGPLPPQAPFTQTGSSGVQQWRGPSVGRPGLCCTF